MLEQNYAFSLTRPHAAVYEVPRVKFDWLSPPRMNGDTAQELASGWRVLPPLCMLLKDCRRANVLCIAQGRQAAAGPEKRTSGRQTEADKRFKKDDWPQKAAWRHFLPFGGCVGNLFSAIFYPRGHWSLLGTWTPKPSSPLDRGLSLLAEQAVGRSCTPAVLLNARRY